MDDTAFKNELLQAIRRASGNERKLNLLLNVLLTPKELKHIQKRLQILKQLYRKVPQRRIAKNLKVSIAKITRGSREMHDPRSAFAQILKEIIL
jgi:TrpR family trp operon transcriptional repressor